MRKNDLIKMLQGIKGNPEIVLWNGFVEDYHHICKELTPLTLVRETRDFVKSSLVNEAHARAEAMPTEAEVDEAMKHRHWEEPNPYVTPEEFNRWYGNKKKTLYVLRGRNRGKTRYDRVGKMEY